MNSAGHHSMLQSNTALPYRRQVDYIDTNNGGCTMSDIVYGPVFGYRTKGRISVVTPSGDFIFGFMRTTSDHDRSGCRTFFSYFNNHYVAWQDIARLRVRTSATANAFELNDFFDFEILSQSTKASSYIKINNSNLLDSYESRSRSPIDIPFGICKESQTSTIYGRIKIASLTIMQGDDIIADFIPVETFSGDAALYNSVNGNIYTATAGDPFSLPT